MVGFSSEECYSFAKKGDVVKWEDGKKWLIPLQAKVNEIGHKCLLDSYTGPVEISLHKSRPNQTNATYGAMAARQSFVDIFPKYSPANPNVAIKKAYTLQIYFRITRHGGEVGFCWGAWTSQGKPELVEGYIEGRDWILWKLSNTPSSIRANLASTISKNGYRYVDQWMDGSSDETYQGIDSWIEGACSEKGASHAIIKTFTPEELEELGGDIEGHVLEAMRMFTPLFDYVHHNPDATPRPLETTKLKRTWLKGYSKAKTDTKSAYTNPFTRDPDAIDRANNAHSMVQNNLRDFVKERGHKTFSPQSRNLNFDLAWDVRGVLYVAEIKSIRDGNEESQLRHGLGQVLHYKQKFIDSGNEAVKAVLAVEKEPTDSIWSRVCEMAGVVLVWPEIFDSLFKTESDSGPSVDELPDWLSEILDDTNN